MPDEQYRRDFESALKLLSGPPSTWFERETRANELTLDYEALRTPPHPFDPDRVADVLARLTFRRTVVEQIRLVMYTDENGTRCIGKVAKSPWGIGWVISTEKGRDRYTYSSIRSAGLAVYSSVVRGEARS